MRRFFAAVIAMALSGVPAWAQSMGEVVDGHVLPGYRTLAATGAQLAATAQQDCSPESPALRAAFGTAFDAWVLVSHLRFGPSEENDRAFALAFWPDPRGSTPKTLGRMLRDDAPGIADPAQYSAVSVAARGFYALEFLLYDPQFLNTASPELRCTLIQTVAADIALTTGAILEGWEDGYADLVRQAGSNDIYRSEAEAARQFFTALSTGLQFTSAARLGRPLGTFDKPRPNRAEARRSERSLRHVLLSLQANRALAALLSDNHIGLDAAFQRAIDRAEALDDPAFAGVSDPAGRIRIEALLQSVDGLRRTVAEDLGPQLGVAAGFNSLDGD